jgi:uncharacterized protein (DUF433 family)
VRDVLNWLAAGMTEDEILDDYPELDRDDFRAVLRSGDSRQWYRIVSFGRNSIYLTIRS